MCISLNPHFSSAAHWLTRAIHHLRLTEDVDVVTNVCLASAFDGYDRLGFARLTIVFDVVLIDVNAFQF